LVFEGAALLREARSVHGLSKDITITRQGGNELPTVVFDGPELAQKLN
jgi:hypothetical protein